VGAPRIHGDLLKLGIAVSQATVAKYMGRDRLPPSQNWRTFLANHIGQVVAADFFVVPTATCRLLFVLVLVAHERRRVAHVACKVRKPWLRRQDVLANHTAETIATLDTGLAPLRACGERWACRVGRVEGQRSVRPVDA
jgi:hypothetical protein